jgi:hypothetical protein
MSTVYLTGNEPLVRKIANVAFPNYTGKAFKLQSAETVDVRSYWDGGSRDYYAFVQLTGEGDSVTVKRGMEVPQQSMFDKQIAGADSVKLDSVPGLVCVRHTYFCGKDMGITIMLHPSMMSQAFLPPAAPEMTDDEKSVLKVTCERKAGYGGVSRREYIGMPVDRWDAALASLVSKGMIDKRKAVTPAGRNAHGNIRGY